jgi:hypothetical protein
MTEGEAFRQLRYLSPPERIADRTVAEEYFAVSQQVEALYDTQPILPATAEGCMPSNVRSPTIEPNPVPAVARTARSWPCRQHVSDDVSGSAACHLWVRGVRQVRSVSFASACSQRAETGVISGLCLRSSCRRRRLLAGNEPQAG